MYLKILFKMS